MAEYHLAVLVLDVLVEPDAGPGLGQDGCEQRVNFGAISSALNPSRLAGDGPMSNSPSSLLALRENAHVWLLTEPPTKLQYKRLPTAF
jgi:hypothetical protein